MPTPPPALDHAYVIQSAQDVVALVQGVALCDVTVEVLDALIRGAEGVLESAGLPFGPLTGCAGRKASDRRLLTCRLIGIVAALHGDRSGTASLGQDDLAVIEHLMTGIDTTLWRAIAPEPHLTYDPVTGTITKSNLGVAKRRRRIWP